MSNDGPSTSGPAAARLPGTMVTFYSHSGGVGRTMALANVGWLLADAGFRVLVIDWALSGPGLRAYFQPFLRDPELGRDTGVLEMLHEYGEAADQLAAQLRDGQVDQATHDLALAELQEAHSSVGRHMDSVQWTFAEQRGGIDFLGPGCQNDQYSERLSAFDWAHFYGQQAGNAFITRLGERLRTGEHDFVLVDTRAGHLEQLDVRALLPDVVVAGFTLGNESVEGTTAALRSIRARAGRTVTILPVPMRVDGTDRSRTRRRTNYVEAAFSGLVGPLYDGAAGAEAEYWRQVRVDHSADFGYEEVLALFVLEPGDRSSQLQAYERLAWEISRGRVGVSQVVDEARRADYLSQVSQVPSVGGRAARIVYAEQDRPWADWIRSELALRGINCTVGTCPASSGGQAPLTIVVASESLSSMPEFAEILNQYGRASWQPQGRAQFVAVRIDESQLPEPFAQMPGPRLHTLGEIAGRQALLGFFMPNSTAEGIARQTLPTRDGARFPGSMLGPVIWRGPTRQQELELCRQDALKELRDHLPPGGAADPVVLRGQRGVGKTTMANEFCHRFVADYDAVWWIDADSPESIRKGLAELGQHLGVTGVTTDDSVQRTLAALAEGTPTHLRFLVVYDHARKAFDLEGLLPSRGHAHVLVIAENGGWGLGGRTIEVLVPSEKEAVAQLVRTVPGLTDSLGAELVGMVGCLPQTLARAAAFVRRTGLGYQQAIDEYRDRTSSGPIASAEDDLLLQRDRAAWRLQLEELTEEQPLAPGILRLLVHLAKDGVARDVLHSSAALAYLDPSGKLDANRTGRLLRTLFDSEMARTDQLANRVIGDRMGLDFLLETMPAEATEEARRAVRSILAAYGPPDDDQVDAGKNIEVFRELDRHVTACGAVESEDPEVRLWMLHQVRYLRRAQRPAEALLLATRLMESWQDEAESRSLLFLRLEVELANIHREAGQFHESDRLNSRAFRELTDMCGPSDIHTLRSAMGRGAELRALGQPVLAFSEDQSTWTILCDVLGEDHPTTLMAAGNLAASLAMQGLAVDARDLDLDTLSRRRRLLDEDDPLTLHSALRVGVRHRECGDYQKSLDQLQQVFRQAMTHLGVTHVTTLRISRELAATWRLMGTQRGYESARKFDVESVRGFTEYGGSDHHEVLAAKVGLAEDLRLLGRTEDARELAESCVAAYGTWESSHPNFRIAQVNLALCVRAGGGDGLDLSREGWRGLRDTFSENHRLVLTAALNHANALALGGQAAAALELDGRTLDSLRDVCGDSHPLTQTAEANLRNSRERVEATGPAREGIDAERRDIGMTVPSL